MHFKTRVGHCTVNNRNLNNMIHKLIKDKSNLITPGP
jgi:hypothetical protein